MANPLPDPAGLGAARRPHRLYNIDVHTATTSYQSARGALTVDSLVVQARNGQTIETLPIDEGTLVDPAREGVEPVLDRRGRPKRPRGSGRQLRFESGGSPVVLSLAGRCSCNGMRIIDLTEQNDEE